MKIIDTVTGKRLDGLDKKTQAQLAKTDPVKRNVEKGLEDEEYSPMDPPEAYELTGDLKDFKMEDLSTPLQALVHEHEEGMKMVTAFEAAMIAFRDNQFQLNEGLNDAFTTFFSYFEDEFLAHNRREEKYLFPIMHERLIASGKHSKGEPKTTAVDLFEDDHVKFIQLAALCFNFLGLGVRLRDPRSQLLVMDVAVNNGLELVELIKLHIFREDHTLFPLAQRLLSPEELAAIEAKL